MAMKVLDILRRGLRAASEAVFPAVCECCGCSLINGEKLLCLKCEYEIPRTSYHRDSFSEIHKRLAMPQLPIERTAAMFHYIKESPYALLIQKAKYNNRPSIIKYLSAMFAAELSNENFFDGIDMLLPIPMHRFKKLRRGYNQSELIANEISRITGIETGDNLTALPHSTQTRKNALERSSNVAGTIKVSHADELQGKHILLIDDVITTGATLLTAAKAIHAASPSSRISVLTLAASKLQ